MIILCSFCFLGGLFLLYQNVSWVGILLLVTLLVLFFQVLMQATVPNGTFFWDGILYVRLIYNDNPLLWGTDQVQHLIFLLFHVNHFLYAFLIFLSANLF